MARVIDLGRVGPAVAGAEAAKVLEAGGVIALPTDTVYGVAVLPDQPAALDRLFALKGRPTDRNVAVLVSDIAQALDLVDLADTNGRLPALMARFWPGPLTIVMRRQPELVWDLGADATSIGLRCPNYSFVRSLAARVGPVATTSANPHGWPTPFTAAGVLAALPGLDLVVDGGPCSGVASTVLLANVEPPVVAREGALPAHVILDALAL